MKRLVVIFCLAVLHFAATIALLVAGLGLALRRFDAGVGAAEVPLLFLNSLLWVLVFSLAIAVAIRRMRRLAAEGEHR